MAITKNAKKAHRGSLRKRVYNIRRKVVLHDVVKDFSEAVSKGKRDEAKAMLPKVYQAIDKAAKRGVIKPNTAARKKARLTKSLASSR